MAGRREAKGRPARAGVDGGSIADWREARGDRRGVDPWPARPAPAAPTSSRRPGEETTMPTAATKIHRRHNHISLLLDTAATTTSPSSSTPPPPPPHPHRRLPGQIWVARGGRGLRRQSGHADLAGWHRILLTALLLLLGRRYAPPVARAREAIYDAVLDSYGSGDHDVDVLLCDRGRHTFCLRFIAARTWGPCGDIRVLSTH
ncbi:unnamed protein product [Urochloa humidicola]